LISPNFLRETSCFDLSFVSKIKSPKWTSNFISFKKYFWFPWTIWTCFCFSHLQTILWNNFPRTFARRVFDIWSAFSDELNMIINKLQVFNIRTEFFVFFW
jgi:hypothetical protein